MGTSCVDALAVSFYNNGANWGAGAGKISADDTVHFCGTITTQLEAQGSGTSGHPINLDATGATFEAPFWTVTGAFYFPGVSHFILNGGSTGIIQNTANGDGLANQQVSSGIYMSSCDDIEVKNLTIANIYSHTQNSSSMGSPDSYGIADDGCSNTNWHDNVVHDVYIPYMRIASNSGSNLQWHDTHFYNFNWAAGITAAGTGVVLDGVYFYNNTCDMGNNWDDTGNNNHHNCVHAYTDPSADGRIQNLYFYNNKCKGETGQVWTATGCLFTEYGIESLWAFNNIFDGVMGDPADGYIDLEFGVISQTAYIANNVFIGTTTTGWTSSFGDVFPKCIMLANNSSMVATIKNNVCTNVVYGVLTATGSTFTADNDVIYNAGTTGVVNGTFHSTFSDWQTAGYDASGSNADPNLTGTYTLGSGSSAIGLGANLYSTCNGQPTPGLGSLCSDYAATARPSSGAWDAGVYTSAPITISDIVSEDITGNSTRIIFTIGGTTVSPYSQIEYGYSSGSYPYQSADETCYTRTDPCHTNGIGARDLTGLKYNTTYYFRVCARPNPSDDTGKVCSLEQTVTTLDIAPGAPPVAGSAWMPTSAPDTTGYTDIQLEPGTSGECWAASAASSPVGWSVTSHEYLTSMLTHVGFASRFLLPPHGQWCKVPIVFFQGYVLPHLGLDSNVACGGTCTMDNPYHRWMVFDTPVSNTADLPPYGSRIDPSYSPKLGGFCTEQYARPGVPYAGSQFFTAEGVTLGVHHIWFAPEEWTTCPSFTETNLNPESLALFASLGSTYNSVNNAYIILDRVYGHWPGAPFRSNMGIEFGGNYTGTVGSYFSGLEFWTLPTYTGGSTGTLTSGNTVLNIPQATFKETRSGATEGMTSGSATATLSSITGAGNAIGQLTRTGLRVKYTSGIGALTCSGCTAVPTSPTDMGNLLANNPRDYDAYVLFTASISAGGQFTIDYWGDRPYGVPNIGITLSYAQGADGGPYVFENTFIDGVGQSFYTDSNCETYTHQDFLFRRNHLIWPKTAFDQDPGNERRYDVRQHFELKCGQKALVKGNWFSNGFSFQNTEAAIFLSGRTPYSTDYNQKTSITDVDIDSNLSTHTRTGISLMGSNTIDNFGHGQDGQILTRVAIHNNLFLDVNYRRCSVYNCPGVGSAILEERTPASDVAFYNNTSDSNYGIYPGFIQAGGGAHYSSYLQVRKNIIHFETGVGGMAGPGGIVTGDWPTQGHTGHEVTPAMSFTNSGASPPHVTNLNQFVVNHGSSDTHPLDWGENLMVAGHKCTSDLEDFCQSGWTEMNGTEWVTYMTDAPAGDTYCAGETLAARYTNCGITSTWRSTTYTDRGADIDALYSAMGRVTGISANAGIGTLTIEYTAPDSRSCAVDRSDAGGTTFTTRSTDGGGSTSRSVVFSGLSTGSYKWRIDCYYDQANDGVLISEYLSSEITQGTTAVSNISRSRDIFTGRPVRTGH